MATDKKDEKLLKDEEKGLEKEAKDREKDLNKELKEKEATEAEAAKQAAKDKAAAAHGSTATASVDATGAPVAAKEFGVSEKRLEHVNQVAEREEREGKVPQPPAPVPSQVSNDQFIRDTVEANNRRASAFGVPLGDKPRVLKTDQADADELQRAADKRREEEAKKNNA